MENGWYIAAVADGVGSAENSQIGAQLAVNSVVDFCYRYMPCDYDVESIKSMIRTAFNYAYKQILKESQTRGEPIESYDTTLSMVIYDGQRIIYGHSGDGAIIGLTTFGDYVEITRPQKGSDGISVLPLRAGYAQWVIDTYEEDLVSVLLMTDGMRETLCPYLLRVYDPKTVKAYIPLISFFADPAGISDNTDFQQLRRQIEEFLVADENYPSENFYARLLDIYNSHMNESAIAVINDIKKNNFPIILMQNEQDDKTIVGLINTDVPLDDKPIEFYSEPNWAELQEEWNRVAYPHLYRKEK